MCSIRMRHMTHSYVAHAMCYTNEWDMTHSVHVLHTNESRVTYECVMSHTWRQVKKNYSYVAHVMCYTNEWDMTHSAHVLHTNESCVTYECVMSHTWRHAKKKWFVCSTCLVRIHMCNVTLQVFHVVCGTWRIHMWHVTHSYMGHDSFIRVMRLFRCSTSCVGHDALICETWLIRMCETWLIHMWDVTRLYV